jgi:hypothetical protein
VLGLGCAEAEEGFADGGGDLFDGLPTVDLLEAALGAVVVDDGGGLRVEDAHAVVEDGLGVVGALGEGGTVDVAVAGDAGWVGVDVVDAVTVMAMATTGSPLARV